MIFEYQMLGHNYSRNLSEVGCYLHLHRLVLNVTTRNINIGLLFGNSNTTKINTMLNFIPGKQCKNHFCVLKDYFIIGLCCRSQLQQVRSSVAVCDLLAAVLQPGIRTQASCIGSTEFQPQHHQEVLFLVFMNQGSRFM